MQPPYPRWDDDLPDDEDSDDSLHPFSRRDDQPIIRRIRRDRGLIVEDDSAPADDAPPPAPVRVTARAANTDPTFGLLICFALNIGLAALGPAYGDLRFMAAWSALALFGVGAWLIGSTVRVGSERVENLAWGVVFGVLVGAPLLVVGGRTLSATTALIFRTGTETGLTTLSLGAVLALVVFVMPLGETLFFRGLLQTGRPFWLAGAAASVWSVLLFFPMVETAQYPLIAVLTGSALVLMNVMYSYVCQRNGLAAAWLCQITINLLVFVIPFATRA